MANLFSLLGKRGRQMSHRIFEPCSVRHGDRMMRGYRVTCFRCGAGRSIAINDSGKTRGGNDDEIRCRRAQTKLEEDGWHIGKREQDDLCPTCIAAKTGGKPIMTNVTPLPTTQPAKPTEPTASPTSGTLPIGREERRIIFSKLEEVYQDEQTGYRSGWTDARVAADLCVPITWVAHLREENFGSLADNPQLREILDQAKALVTEVKEKVAETQRLATTLEQLKSGIADVQRMGARIEAIEKKLHNIEKGQFPR